MARIKDLTGKVYGRLTVIKREGVDNHGYSTWLCQCTCGGVKIIAGARLRLTVGTRSCGCLQKEKTSNRCRLKDFKGKTFGRLTVVNQTIDKIKKKTLWLCRCECGKEKEIVASLVKSGVVKSCGCLVKEVLVSNFKDLTGQVFGRLTVIRRLPNNKHDKAVWLCYCECGEEKSIVSGLLMCGKVKSCGCLATELLAKRFRENNPYCSRLPEGEANFNSLYLAYKNNAKSNDILFSISKGFFRQITSSDCHYCGVKPMMKRSTSGQKKLPNGFYLHNGIDRIDSNKGYIPENCLPCCSICNFAKRTLSYENFLQHIYKISLHLKLTKKYAPLNLSI